MHRTLLENVLNCFQLAILVVMTCSLMHFIWKYVFQNAMTFAKLKQLTKGVMDILHMRDFDGLGVLSTIQLPLGDGIVLAELTWYFII